MKKRLWITIVIIIVFSVIALYHVKLSNDNQKNQWRLDYYVNKTRKRTIFADSGRIKNNNVAYMWEDGVMTTVYSKSLYLSYISSDK